MNHDPRLVVRLPHTWCISSPEAIAAVAQAAEELGFWGVSVQDHLLADSAVSPCGSAHAGDDRMVFETLQTLTYVTALTKRVKLVAGVIVLPFHQPVLLAKQLATLDVLSGGRLVAGVGVGALLSRREDSGQHLDAHRSIAAQEFDIFGIHGDRGPYMDEAIEAMTSLWTQDSSTYLGQRIRFEGVEMYPKPIQRPRPPIWVGGRSLAAQRRVARQADGWFPSQATVEDLSEGRQTIERLAAEAGRSQAFDYAVNIFAAVDHDGARAREAMRDGLGRRFAGDEPLFAATIAGDPAAFVARMAAYAEVGVTTFDLKFVPLTVPDTLAQMALVAQEVMPALRSVVAAASVG